MTEKSQSLICTSVSMSWAIITWLVAVRKVSSKKTFMPTAQLLARFLPSFSGKNCFGLSLLPWNWFETLFLQGQRKHKGIPRGFSPRYTPNVFFFFLSKNVAVRLEPLFQEQFTFYHFCFCFLTEMIKLRMFISLKGNKAARISLVKCITWGIIIGLASNGMKIDHNLAG